MVFKYIIQGKCNDQFTLTQTKHEQDVQAAVKAAIAEVYGIKAEK